MERAAAADLLGHAGPGVPQGHRRRHPPAGVPPDRGPGGRPGHHLRPPGRHHRGVHQGLLRRRLRAPACGRRTSRSPSRRPSSTSIRPDGTWLELGGCGMVHPNVLAQLRHRPRGVVGLRLRLRHRPPRHDAPRRRRPPRRLSPTTSASSSSSDDRSLLLLAPRVRAARRRPSTRIADDLDRPRHGGRGGSTHLGAGPRRRRRGPGARACASTPTPTRSSSSTSTPATASRSQIVCGAFNMAVGDLVPLATLGTDHARRHGDRPPQDPRRVVQRHALLARRARALGDDHGGILVLPDDAADPGTPIARGARHRARRPLRPRDQPQPARRHVGRRASPATSPPARRARSRCPTPSVARRRARPPASARVEILDPDLCGRFAAAVLRGVAVGPVAR